MLQIQFTGFEQKLFFNQKPFVAKIYDGKYALPDGFNVVLISLDLSSCSLLHWTNEILFAKQATDKGFLILWDLQFDLDNCSQDDDVCFLSFELNIQHFTQTIFKEFQAHTFGVSLFRGELNIGLIDSYKSLGALLPDEMSCFIFLDTSHIKCPLTYFQSLANAKLGSLNLILKGYFAECYPFAFPALGWDHGNSPLGYCASIEKSTLVQTRIQYALLLPKISNVESIQAVLDALKSCAFRVIPEHRLTQEWEGIDTLILFSEDLHNRSVKGFIAAGGNIIEIPNDATWLLPPEISQPFCPAS